MKLRGIGQEWVVAATLIILLLVLFFAAPSFFQRQPLLSLAAREAPTLIVSCGIAVVIICREIDISIGSLFSVCGIFGALLCACHWPFAWALLASIGMGAVMGAINGALVAGLRLPSIVVTLATMVFWREGLRWLRQGQFVNLPDEIQWFGFSQATGQMVIISTAILLFAIIALASRYLAGVRFVYAIGSDHESARLAGIRTQLVTFFVFIGMGALAGLAATLNLVQSPQVDPKAGTGLELKAIAAAVVSGIAITGGRGNLWGIIAGIALLGSLGPALTHLHVQAYWEKALQGLIILSAITAEHFRQKRK